MLSWYFRNSYARGIYDRIQSPCTPVGVVNAPVGSGHLSASVQYSWESNVYYSPVNEVPASSEGGWKRMDARVGYEMGNGVEFYAFGKNLNDKRYVSWVTRANATGLLVSFSEPRTVGVGMRYKLQK